MFTNCGGLRSKLTEIKHICEKHSPSIFIIVESWVNDSIPDEALFIDNYLLFRKDRKSGLGGGLVVYYTKFLEIELIDNWEDVESMWMKILIGQTEIILGCFYRAPNSHVLINDKIIESIKNYGKCTKKNYKLLIIGDFNLPRINWRGNKTSYSEGSFGRTFFDLVNDLFLYQLVEEDTRIRNKSSSLLDIVLCNNKQDFNHIEMMDPVGKSDHRIIWCISSLTLRNKDKQVQVVRRVLNFRSANYKLINDELMNFNWDDIFIDVKKINDDYNMVNKHISDIILRNVAYKRLKGDTNKGFISFSTKILMKTRNKKFRKYMKNKDINSFIEFKKARNLVIKEIRREKKQFISNLLKKSKSNKNILYHYLRQNKSQNNLISKLRVEDKDIEDEKEICNQLGRHFSRFNVSDVIAECRNLENNYEWTEISFSEVEGIIKNLNNSMITSIEIYNNFFIKNCACFFAIFIFKIANISFSSGNCPELWKESLVFPKFKKGRRNQLEAYRPISLVSPILKIVEIIMLRRIDNHIYGNKILASEQHGFRYGYSTTSNLLELVDFISFNCDKGYDVDVVYLDLKSAFDKVSLNLLFRKMTDYRFDFYIIRWLDNVMRDRKIFVDIGENRSDVFIINTGVPQGSRLSAALFNIYLADSLICDSSMLLYADDVKIFRSIQSLSDCETLEYDINVFKKWCFENNLDISYEKSSILSYGKNIFNYNYKIDGETINRVNLIKDLGIWFDNRLHFSDHVARTIGKIRARFGWIKSRLGILSVEDFRNLYKIYIQPLFDYGSPVFSIFLAGDCNSLEKTFRGLTKQVRCLENVAYENRLKILRLIPPKLRLLRNDICFLYRKVIYERDVRFPLNSRNNARGHKYLLSVSQRNTNMRGMTIFHRCINDWNKLPRDIFDTNSFKKFQQLLDDLLFKKYFNPE